MSHHSPTRPRPIRTPCAAGNPYLVASGLLAAGIDGIVRQIEPPAPTETIAYTDESATKLPQTLGESLDSEMQSHVDSCPRCRARLEQLRSEADLLRRAARGDTTTPSGPAAPRPVQRTPAVIGKLIFFPIESVHVAPPSVDRA